MKNIKKCFAFLIALNMAISSFFIGNATYIEIENIPIKKIETSLNEEIFEETEANDFSEQSGEFLQMASDVETPSEVQMFIEKVNGLPENINPENVEEIGNQLAEILDFYEKLIEFGYDEREDVLESMMKVYEINEKIEKMVGLEAENYLYEIPGFAPTDRYYYDSEEVCQLYEGTYANNPVYKYKNPAKNKIIKVGETSSEQYLFTKCATCHCGNLLIEITPDWIAVDKNRKLTNSNLGIIKNINFNLSGYIPEDTTDAPYKNYPVLEFHFTGKKPGTTKINLWVYQNYYYAYYWRTCKQCGQVYSEISFKGKWIEDEEILNITVNADYLLNYIDSIENKEVIIEQEKQTVASDFVSIPLTTDIPQKDGYEFCYWEDVDTGNTYRPVQIGNTIKWQNATFQDIDGTVRLNWEDGFGTEEKPVTKTLKAVWEEKEESIEPPQKDDLYGILRNFVKVHCIKDKHEDKTFSTMSNSNDASIGETYLKDGKYCVDITLNGGTYCRFYGFEPSFGVGELHELIETEDETKIITLTYNKETKKWESGFPKGTVLVTFNTICKDSRCNYSVNHSYYTNNVLDGEIKGNEYTSMIEEIVLSSTITERQNDYLNNSYGFSSIAPQSLRMKKENNFFNIRYDRYSYKIKYEYLDIDGNIEYTDEEEFYGIEDEEIKSFEYRKEKDNYHYVSDTGDIIISSDYKKNIITVIYQKNKGSYLVTHEYYTRDKDKNLILNKTISDEPITLEAGIILNTYTIEQKIEADYIFSEISEDSITIEADIQKTVTIKYIREEKYGSYVIKHEYYVKDKDNHLTLEDSVSNTVSDVVAGTVIKSDDIEQIPNNNNKDYVFSEASENITIEENATKEIIFKYIRNEKYGSYIIKHEYYVKDKDNHLTLEDSVSNIVSDVVAGTVIKSDKIEQISNNNNKEYVFSEASENITIEENTVKEIILKYVRDKEYGSYVVKHNYYLKDKDENFILEETVSENPILTEPGNIVGLKDADIIIPKKLKDGYTFKDASKNMVIKVNEEAEFSINYFREEPVVLKIGSYQVIHQYYLDDNLEATINENIVPNVLVGTSIGVEDADIIASKKENYDNKEYVFDSADKAIIKEDETVILTIKYMRKSQLVIEPVSVVITATKELKNASSKENKGFVLPCKPNQFSFRLTNNVDTYVASNDANGNISFNPITFNVEGTYRYYLTEDDTKEANIKYDESIYVIEITISNIENRLNASVRYLKDGKEADTLSFINIYEQPEQIEEKPDEPPIQNETITIIPEEEPPKTTIKQPKKENQNDGLVEIEDEPVPKAMEPSATGDDSSILIYFILFIGSAMLMILIKRKKL